jgi:hypothetical protein
MKPMFPVFKRTQICAKILHLTSDLRCIRILAHDASALLNENAGFGIRTVITNILHILIMSKDRLEKGRISKIGHNWPVQIKLSLCAS